MEEKFTLGIEEEYMVIHPQTRELTSHDQKIVEIAIERGNEQLKAEMHQAVVESGTLICTDITDARKQVGELRRTAANIAGELGLRIGASGTHPFSQWSKQLITPNPRYFEIVNEMQDAARSNLIFGLHVHVGIKDKNMAIHIANSMRYFLPHVYALSTNSPFWEGRITGFKSFRAKIFERFPRTGLPDFFNDYDEFQSYVNLLIKTGCIDNAKKIWWDLRVHPFFDTVEYRICDLPMTLDETMMVAAIFQALSVKLYRLRQKNLNFIQYSRVLINENRWRACRYGIEGKMIDFGKQVEVETRSLIAELLEFIDDVVDDLGSRETVNLAYKIMETGTGADRQLDVFRRTKDMDAVVDYICDQTLIGC